MRKKGIILLGIVAMMFTLTAFTRPVSSLTTSLNVYAAASIQMSIVISGLAQGETATLLIGPETPDLEVKNALFEYQVNGTGVSIKEDISPVLEDGNYLLLLDAPSHYFRDPKGYFFNIRDSTFVNPIGKTFTFDLKPRPPYPVLEAVILSATSLNRTMSVPAPLAPTTPNQTHTWQKLPVAAAIATIVITLVALAIWWRRSRVKIK